MHRSPCQYSFNLHKYAHTLFGIVITTNNLSQLQQVIDWLYAIKSEDADLFNPSIEDLGRVDGSVNERTKLSVSHRCAILSLFCVIYKNPFSKGFSGICKAHISHPTRCPRIISLPYVAWIQLVHWSHRCNSLLAVGNWAIKYLGTNTEWVISKSFSSEIWYGFGTYGVIS